MLSHINFIRAIAIFGIFSWHYVVDLFRVKHRLLGTGVLSRLIGGVDSLGDAYWAVMSALTAAGAESLSLFFITSGLGLYLSHLRSPRTWREFSLRRAIRIIPLYWLALVFTYAAYKLWVPVYTTGSAFLIHLPVIVHTLTPYANAFGPLWFVGIISQLYLLFPLLAIAFDRARSSRACWLIFIATLFLDGLVHEIIQMAGIEFRGKLPTEYLPLFTFGMILARDIFHGNGLIRMLVHPLASIAFAALFGFMVYFSNEPGLLKTLYNPNVYHISTFLMLTVFWAAIWRLKFISRAVMAVSFSSYAICLFHLPLYRIMIISNKGLMIPDNQTLFSILLPVLFIVVTIISYFIQKGYNGLAAKALKKQTSQ